MSMDDETAKYLWALKEINKSLITGLESAILVMDKWDDITGSAFPITITGQGVSSKFLSVTYNRFQPDL